MTEQSSHPEIQHRVHVDITPKPEIGGYREIADMVLTNIGLIGITQELEKSLGHEREGHKEKDELARTDELTGLKNRRAFNETFDDQVEAAIAENRPLAVFYVDIDGLKRVNDDRERGGTEAGDELIKTVATKLSSITRAGDEVYRYGGDEFVVVLPNFMADRPEDDDVRKRGFRAAGIRNKYDEVTNEAVSQIRNIPSDLYAGVSIGVAVSRSGEAPRELLKRSVTEMYRNKDQRRSDLAAAGIIFADSRMLMSE